MAAVAPTMSAVCARRRRSSGLVRRRRSSLTRSASGELERPIPSAFPPTEPAGGPEGDGCGVVA
ncbi:MAG: hypothetical protein AVDCRST_MAG69-1085 [uncultured Solirubrobacteraceae bacterium]|uniref:Uncharacterized protein n=1 Tax=uncultured Solirubrobacteraceae bacterium TaxID=1162706 RepID=A0A6J4S0H6_9ACTN|nr:MAG: hypothetical protein AVDCRST_MAG69-1085 [uncultured Solirubrobacteraceae bacterium]